jgi:hypothetical protein
MDTIVSFFCIKILGSKSELSWVRSDRKQIWLTVYSFHVSDFVNSIEQDEK